ncbi:MAG TPA: DUF4349 domain-containing protein, partial [Nocardioidaceae bacterium]|nr:DUF4349 domain-containing protein [Nocardioidaceae bacterium]
MTWSHRLRFAAATLSLGALVAGCGASDGGSEAGDSTADRAGGAEAHAGRVGEAKAAPLQDRVGVNRSGVQTKSVISTGRITLTHKRLDQTRDDVDDLLLAMGGSVDSELTSHDDAGRIKRSTLVLRVPVASFKAAMDALEKLGKVEASNSKSEDVTTEVIDVNERVETLENSLDRLQKFQRQSDNIDDLILFEGQITQRESELRSLQTQQAFLDDQTAMSTISVDLSTPEGTVALTVHGIAQREIFLCDRCFRPQVDPFGHQRTPVGSICGPLAELGRRSCGADVAGWLNATVP